MDQSQMLAVKEEHREPQVKSLAHKDRRTRRAFTPTHRVGPFQAAGSSRVRSGIRTGTTPHFKLWMADLSMRSALQKTRTAALAEHIDDAQVSSAMALFHVGQIRNVWTLIRADKARLLAVKGIGPNRLKAVHAYLIEHDVKPSWTVE